MEKKPVGRSEDLLGQDPSFMPENEEIARLAYILWQARGGGDGRADQDWFEAEQQLQLRKKVQAA